MKSSPTSGLRRAIRLPHATAMVVGTIIGASIFVQPSEVTARVPTLWGSALVWAVAGGLTLMGALVTAELASLHPESGGVYVYLREAFGPWLGFLWGWAMFWVMHSGIIAAVAMVFGSYVDALIPLGSPGATKGVAVAVIVNKENHDLDKEQILDWLEGKLGHYKHPRDVLFVKALPRNEMRKVMKPALCGLIKTDQQVTESD